ncbi:Hypothetical predicted protein [Mytilus galloprovincialis]|uniref:Uncharacterized protein n=1 Tax=Mytilus galloprovincialis TaxID=29158 RepID=A0A8B6BRV2_MYTGA|nr:Hypothetical predicted protein [Mytilus galloprovincialis]
MTGTWYDNKFLEVEFSSSLVMYFNQYSITRSGSTSNFTCYLNSGDRYIVKTTETVVATLSGGQGNYYYYLCMTITQITSHSFYYYIQAAVDNNGERTVAKLSSETPGVNDICTTTAVPTEIFQVMVHKDYASSAVQQCATPFLGNFKFTFEDTISETSTGNITACDTLNTANVSYATGASNALKVAFSAQYDSTNVTASQRIRMCHVGQTATSKPSDTANLYPESAATSGGLLHLTPYLPTTDSSDSSNTGVIIAIVVILLLLIIAVVAGILFYKFYYKPKQDEKKRLIEEQKKPRSHIGMMRKAVDSGIGGGIHKEKEKIDMINMVDIDDDDGIEGSITGINPDKFREHNNNMKLSASFIGTSTPATPSGVDADFSDPNSVPENGNSKEKPKLTSGFSANMQGTTSNETPRTAADLNGHIPNGHLSGEMAKQPVNKGNEQNGQIPNGNTPGDKTNQAVNAGQPTAVTNAVVHNSTSGIRREKSIMKPATKDGEALNDKPVLNVPTEKKTTIATINPYTEEKPTIPQQNPQPTEDDKREDKLRKSVSFAPDKPAITSNSSSNSNNAPPGILNMSKEKTSLPGAIQDVPDTLITLPRERSNLLGPRDTTLPEIDLKKNTVPDMSNF